MQGRMKPLLGEEPDYNNVSREGLALDLIMNENGGNKILDYSTPTHPNNGTNNGAEWVAGQYGPALSFDGVNNYVVVLGSGSINTATGVGQPRTWTYWIKPNKANSNRLITDKSNFGAKHLWSEFQTGPDRIVGGVSIGSSLNTQSTLTLNEWQLITFTYDGVNTRLYRNGLLVDGPHTQTAPAVDSAVFQIGATAAGTNAMGADMSSITIFSRDLSIQEIKAIYNNPWQAWQRDNIALWAASQGGAPPTGFKSYWTQNFNNLIGAA
jgi:hypothetical protein